MTDVEFVEIRYSGRAAAFLSGFRALYLGLFMNAIVMGWVNKAMEKIFHVTVPGVDSFILVVITALIIAVYASASGLLGTARTDSFQFVFAMAGCILLAVIVVGLPQVGGLAGLKGQLAPQVLSFFPKIARPGWAGSPAGFWPSRPARSWPTSDCSGGRAGIPARTPAAAATSPSG